MDFKSNGYVILFKRSISYSWKFLSYFLFTVALLLPLSACENAFLDDESSLLDGIPSSDVVVASHTFYISSKEVITAVHQFLINGPSITGTI